MPVSGGRWFSSAVKASSPPADAPTPTMGNPVDSVLFALLESGAPRRFRLSGAAFAWAGTGPRPVFRFGGFAEVRARGLTVSRRAIPVFPRTEGDTATAARDPGGLQAA